jgi:hypothetical protein
MNFHDINNTSETTKTKNWIFRGFNDPTQMISTVAMTPQR